jgi:hypothetical protein
MVRSIVAVVVGFVLIGGLNAGTNALLARFAPGMVPADGPVTDTASLLLISAYVALYGILGCYVTARLAPSRPMLHALVLGALGLAFSIPVAVQNWSDAPTWFNVFNLAAVLPYAWVGGWIRERELARAPARVAAS